MSTIISFPGLGIDGFTVNKVAFTVFGRDVMWYGIIIAFGMIMGLLVAMRHAKQERISYDDVMDYAIFTVISAIIGARLYYVLTSLDMYIKDSFIATLREMIAIWEGGLAIYGGVIGGAIAIFVISKIKKIKFGKVCDMIIPALMIGQIIGRWGNFFNAEAHGTVTDLPWRMGLQTVGSDVVKYVHPTFLYESLWNLIGFIIISAVYKKKKYHGQITLMYFAWYGFGRMFIEQLRTDSLYVGQFRISQLVGFVTFAAATAVLIINGIKHKKDKPVLETEAADDEKSDSSDKIKAADKTNISDKTDASTDDKDDKTENNKSKDTSSTDGEEKTTPDSEETTESKQSGECPGDDNSVSANRKDNPDKEEKSNG